MNTEDLIVTLVQAAGPVRPLGRPAARTGRWALAGAAFVAAAVLAIGPRPTLAADLGRVAFAGLALATFATALSAAWAALVLAVPAAARSPMPRMLPVAAGLAWLLWLVALLAPDANAAARVAAMPIHWGCIARIGALGVLPGWLLFRMVSRAAPLQPGWTAALSAIAAFALAALGVQVLCPIDDPAHQLDGHLLPAAVFSVAAALAGARALTRAWRVPRVRTTGSTGR